MRTTKSTIKTEVTYDDEMKNKYYKERVGQEQEKGTCYHEKCWSSR